MTVSSIWLVRGYIVLGTKSQSVNLEILEEILQILQDYLRVVNESFNPILIRSE